MNYIFYHRRTIDQRLDVSSLLPEQLASMSLTEIKSLRLPVFGSSQRVRVEKVFELESNRLVPSPESELGSIRFQGDCSRLDRIGSKMSRGVIVVAGPAGNELGSELREGVIMVEGDCGDDLGSQMCGGCILVNGSAGDRVVGPKPGERSGMRGGDCLIVGNCGERPAERMRRGTLVIGGSTGNFGATFMIAGTVVVLGKIGHHWAGGMKRGSIILADSSEVDQDTFQATLTRSREVDLNFLPLLWRHIAACWNACNDFQETVSRNSREFENQLRFLDKFPRGSLALRQVGDRLVDGRGEIITPASLRAS